MYNIPESEQTFIGIAGWKNSTVLFMGRARYTFFSDSGTVASGMLVSPPREFVHGTKQIGSSCALCEFLSDTKTFLVFEIR